MVLLSSTITISIGLFSFIAISLLINLFVIFIALNIIYFKKFEEKTKDEYPINHTYKKFYNSLFYCGLIIIPLFKGVISDARKFIAFHKKKTDIKYHLSMWGDSDEKDKLVGIERILKMMQLKYSQENFVNRKVFHIFVSK